MNLIESKPTVLIAANPKSGASDRADLVQALTHEIERRDFVVRRLTALDEIASTSHQLLAEHRLKCVVVAGGDGTIAAVTERIPQVPICIFPLGTENLLARYVGHRPIPSVTAELIRKSTSDEIDVGLANDQRFMIVASVGFDAEIVRIVHTARSGHIRKWHYAIPILKQMIQYRFPTLSVTSYEDAGLTKFVQSKQVAWVFVFNVPKYAGGLQICHQADPRDGLFDLCTFRRGGVLRGIWYWMRILTNTLPHCTDFEIERVRSLRIESAESVAYQLDGDYGGQLPLSVRLAPNRLSILRS